ncbi:SDR family NAD(P)-dependent oxidoreductase [Thiohalobacter sp.]|uniref:SDR family NAD(P)-dependent oxidoreductase n=1 Tax=Thiohalobacter sp. TaxID=2025948 RepID=UPI00261F6B5B|nr:SDR family NAD(P)-dependent oxidoreductase [Thiohalobacter sp.]
MTDASRTLLITGCSSGIGHHCAHALKARGWRVFATARRAEDVARLREEGLESLPLDIADPVSIRAAVAEILARCNGRLDGLFNNAGFGLPGAVEDLSRAALREQFETNVMGTLEVTNAVLPAMRRAGQGRILVNSSVLGFISLPYRGAYNASKYALEALFDALRLELADTGIRVSLIEPGPIRSRFRDNAHAAFRRHIDPQQSRHRAVYEGMIRRLERPGPAAPFTLGPEAVTERVIHALENRHPRPRYFVTFPTWLFAGLRRVLTTRMLDRVLLAVSRRENR